MRIYIKEEGKLVTIDQLKKKHTGFSETINVLMHDKFKLQVMWELRSLEREIDLAGGHILLTINNISEPPDISGEGFTEDLLNRIRALASNIVF